MTLCNSHFTKGYIICIQKGSVHRHIGERWSVLHNHVILHLFEEDYTYHHSLFYLLFLPSISYTKHAKKKILSLAH